MSFEFKSVHTTYRSKILGRIDQLSICVSVYTCFIVVVVVVVVVVVAFWEDEKGRVISRTRASSPCRIEFPLHSHPNPCATNSTFWYVLIFREIFLLHKVRK